MEAQRTSSEGGLVELECQNHCPDCISFELTNVQVEKQSDRQLSLALTIEFGEQAEEIFGGKVYFGLRRGELHLSLEKGKLPYEKSLHETFNKKVKEQVSITSTKGKKGGVSNTFGGSTPATPSVMLSFETSQSTGFGRSIEQERLAFRRKGGDRHPKWIFELIASDPFSTDAYALHYLTGTLVEEPLGNLEIESDPFRLEAQFVTEIRDIYLKGVSGIWAEDIGRNPWAILERAIVRFLIRTKLKSPMSYAIFRYGVGKVAVQPKPGIPGEDAIDVDAASREQELQLLKTTIQRVAAAQNESFLNLVSIAKLDLKRDFAGANLRGIDLSNVDFSGADLRDADLKDARLEAAKFNGADLRGANLRNSDLSQADLRGADLRKVYWDGANLRDVNLSGAKLSARALKKVAILDRTQLDSELRISQSLKESLLERGAMIERESIEKTISLVSEAPDARSVLRKAIKESIKKHTSPVSEGRHFPIISMAPPTQETCNISNPMNETRIREIIEGRKKLTLIDEVLLKHRNPDEFGHGTSFTPSR